MSSENISPPKLDAKERTALAAVEELGEATRKDVADATKLNKGQARYQLEKLVDEEFGLVAIKTESSPSKDTLPAKMYYLTEFGERCVEAGILEGEQYDDTAYDIDDAQEDIEDVKDVVRTIANHVAKNTEFREQYQDEKDLTDITDVFEDDD